MKTPTNNYQEILYTLIDKGSCSIMDFPYLSGFRTRISEIKERIELSKQNSKGTNKFGNGYTFAVHILEESNREKAIDLYEKSFNM